MTDLYHTFNKNIPNKMLAKKDRTELLNFVKNTSSGMLSSDKEMFFQLIKEHYCYEEYNKLKDKDNLRAKEKWEELRRDKTIIPYQGTEGQDGMEFDLENLPSNLIHILFKFVKFLKNRDIEN